jgi:hypothetical protein
MVSFTRIEPPEGLYFVFHRVADDVVDDLFDANEVALDP